MLIESISHIVLDKVLSVNESLLIFSIILNENMSLRCPYIGLDKSGYQVNIFLISSLKHMLYTCTH